MKAWKDRVQWYLLKLPLLFLLMIGGVVLEVWVTLPFMILCELRRQDRAGQGLPGRGRIPNGAAPR